MNVNQIFYEDHSKDWFAMYLGQPLVSIIYSASNGQIMGGTMGLNVACVLVL